MDRLVRYLSNVLTGLLVTVVLAYAATSIPPFSNGAAGSLVRTMLNHVLLMQYNVLDYGAVPDGMTDSTMAIQAAINAANLAGGGTVYFPSGVGSGNCYKTTSPIIFTAGGGSGFRGATLKGEVSFDSNGSAICASIDGPSTNITAAAAAPGTGYVRLTVTSSAQFPTNPSAGSSETTLGNAYANIAGVGGTTEANGPHGVVVVDGTHVDLFNTPFVHAYTSGGTVTSPGYVLDATNSSGQTQGLAAIEGLQISNSATAGGGIRWCAQATGSVSKVFVSTKLVGLYAACNNFTLGVYDSTFNSTGADTGGIGAIVGQVQIYNSSFTDWGKALLASNVGTVVIGSRFETNGEGLVLGINESTQPDQLSGCFISGNSTERNTFGMHVQLIAGCSIIGNAVTGTVNPDGGSISECMLVGTITGSLIAGNTFSCTAVVAGVDLSGQFVGGTILSQTTFLGNTANAGGGGVKWLFPAGGLSGGVFIGNNLDASPAIIVANLPSCGVGTTGVQYTVSDGTNGLAWGATVTNTGTHTSTYTVACNGTNWTVVGK